jgi:dolichyl-phosphate-mannose-protein mannosyltransferase
VRTYLRVLHYGIRPSAAALTPKLEIPAIERNSLRTAFTALALGFVSLALFLWRITTPSTFYYDESQYVQSSRALLAGAPNPNPEAPPLGKLLVAVSIRIFGDNPFGWRAIGAFCGALTLVGVFLWSLLLLHDYEFALTAAILTLLNNFLFVMSRIAMMDIFLITFLTLGLLAFTAAAELRDLPVNMRRLLVAFSGILLGLACACKWNGIDTLAAVALLALAALFLGERSTNAGILRYRKSLVEIGIPALLVSLLVLPIAAYSLTYWPLCRSLHLPFNPRQLVAMNVFIWRFHRAVPGNPAIASSWYSWIFQVSPQRALSYLVGNWAVMWGGLLAFIFCVPRFGRSLPHTFLVLLYAANLAQWAVTPQTLLYYYYYFPAAMLLGISLALALQDLPRRIRGVRPSIICITIAACVFLYCFPHMAHLDAPFDCALGCWP